MYIMLKELRDWMNKRKTSVPFAIPVTWREPNNLVDDWRFCCASFSAKNKHKIVYPNLTSAVRPIPHDDNLPVQEPPENGLAFLDQMECENGSSPAATQHSSDDLYTPEEMTSEPKRFNQQELSDIIRNVSLSKDEAELLAYGLKEINLFWRVTAEFAVTEYGVMFCKHFLG
jgi:hypothetical protein